MMLSNLSFLWFALGIVGLGGLLFVMQRLRVRHRDVEVVTTMFWAEALQEHRARVFTRSFKHPWAFLLFLAIAALLWLLLAGPVFRSNDADRHVILLDGSARMGVDGVFEDAVEATLAAARALPRASTDVVFVGAYPTTLLARGEMLPLLEKRLENMTPVAAPSNLDETLRDIVIAMQSDGQLHAHVVTNGDRPMLDDDRVSLTLDQLASDEFSNTGIVALGISESESGRWDRVDVYCEIASSLSTDNVSLTWKRRDTVMQDIVQERDGNTFVLRDVPARDDVLTVTLEHAGDDLRVDDTATISLPDRSPIQVFAGDDVPASLRQILQLDPAVQMVDTEAAASVVFGSSADADFQLTDHAINDAAFEVQYVATESNWTSLQHTANALIDALAIRQIDATHLAEQTKRAIRMDMYEGSSRAVAIWGSLFDEGFDFRDSRACPLFIAGAVRWLANRGPLFPWVDAGEPLHTTLAHDVRPLSSGELSIVNDMAGDDTIHVALLDHDLTRRVDTETNDDDDHSITIGPSLVTWLCLLLLLLAGCEWVLYQRGQLP